jgi:hypothetical protein
LFSVSITPIFGCHRRAKGTAKMMDEALKTHREMTFGWVLALQQLWAALRAPASTPQRSRYLAPR